MSAGGGVSQSGTSTQNIPAWARTYFQAAGPSGMSDLNAFNQAGGSGGVLNQDAATTVGNEVTGANLNPANDPALQAIEANTQQQAQTQFASDQNQIQSGANASGALYSSGVAPAEEQAAQQLATNVSGQTANLENQNYSQQAGIQAGAVGEAQGFNQQSLNDYISMMNAIRGITSNSNTSGYSANITI